MFKYYVIRTTNGVVENPVDFIITNNPEIVESMVKNFLEDAENIDELESEDYMLDIQHFLNQSEDIMFKIDDFNKRGEIIGITVIKELVI